MPMLRVSRKQALSKAEFHKRLREWFQQTGEPVIGGKVDGRTPWVHVNDGGKTFILHADTPRTAVEWYLELVMAEGDTLAWEPALSQRGHMTAVVHGSQRQRHKLFYLYVAE